MENARQKLITRAEIEEKLRGEGVFSMAEVKNAQLESDGSLSVKRRTRG